LKTALVTGVFTLLMMASNGETLDVPINAWSFIDVGIFAAIALYIRPAPNQQPVGYGMSGDAVTITDQFGDYLMEDDPSATWSHIRLEKPPYTEGWLRGKFLLMPSADELSE
ncbi:MAG: hypothetical protein AAF050_11645, partial [Cyanobacteria bacterium J06649_5]